MKKSNIFRWIPLVIGAIAIIDQLRREPEDRTWTGEVAIIPYDFRFPSLQRIQERWWNPDDERILTPHVFGVGWSINLYQVWTLLSGK